MRIVIILLIFIYSCSYLQKSSQDFKLIHPDFEMMLGENLSQSQIAILKDDLEEIKSYEGFHRFFLFLNSREFVLNFSGKNCRTDQVSCFFPNSPKTIFLNENFFKLSRMERLGGILHEVHHLIFKKPHIPCPFDRNQLAECDSDASGAYGLELDFYRSGQDRPGDKKASELFNKNIHRVLNYPL